MLQTWYRNKKNAWLDARIPAASEYQFDYKNTFILPSRFGIGILFIACCLFILGTNYQNNLILILSYFLFALMLLCLFHSYYFFTRLRVLLEAPDANYSQHAVKLRINVLSNTPVFGILHITYRQEKRDNRYEIQGLKTLINFSLGHYPRGIHSAQRLTIAARYPFGLYRCWTHVAIPFDVVVYPTPIASSRKVNFDAGNSNNSVNTRVNVTSDDLQGVREYRDTDPIYHVSWKHLAKQQGWLSKDFTEPGSLTAWLRLQDHSQSDLELALSQLCHQIKMLSEQGTPFGLAIGNQKILPNEGEAHKHLCLTQLAAYPSQEKTISDV